MNLKFIQSAFDRLGNDSDILQQISDNTQVTAESVVSGGELFDRIDRMVVALEKIEESTKSGQGGIQEAIVLKLVAPTLKPIGLGMQFIIDALNSLPDATAAGEKMDALTKGLVILGDVGKSILKFAAYMILATPLLVVTALLAPIWITGLYLITKGLMWATDNLDEKRLEKISLLGDVGAALLKFAGSLALVALLTPLALVGLLGATILILGISVIFKVVDKLGMDAEKMEAFGSGLQALALGLLGTGIVLALLSFAVKPVLIGLAVAGAIVIGIGLMFFVLDKLGVDKSMRKTSMALMFAGLAIVVLATSILLASILLPPFVTGVLPVLGTVAAIALLFYVAGLGASQIAKGALALGFAGLALIILGFGVSIMANAVPDIKTGLGMIALIGGLGVVFALIGAYESGMMTGVPLTITLGSVAMLMVGVSLIVLSIGVERIAKAVAPLSLKQAGMIALIIGGLGVGFSAAGLVAPLMLLGAAAFLVAGAALILVAKGIQELTKINFKKLGTIKKTGTGAFNDSGEKGFFGGKKTNLEVAMEAIASAMSLGPLSIIGILAGAPTLMLAGLALTVISKGLLEFDKLSSKIDIKVLSTNVRDMVGVLADEFARIGTEYPGGKKSLFESVFGGGKQSAVADGISSTMGMGGALTGIAQGMQAMANLKFPTKYDKEGNPIAFETMASDAPEKVAKNTAMIISALAIPFSMIGKGYEIEDPDTGEKIMIGGGGKKSLMQRIFGGGSNNPVADGISAVMGMGDALTGIAKGFQAMANLNFPTKWDENGKPIAFEPIDIESSTPLVLKNTKKIVQGLTSVFSDIGSKPNAKRSWFFGRSTVQKGIDLVSEMGTPLYNLAKGVQNMANLKFPTGFDKDGKATGYETIKDITGIKDKVGNNTQLLIQALVDTFIEVGKTDTGDNGWFSNDDFQNGVDLITQIANPYKKLGSGIKDIIEIVGKVDTKAFAGKVQDVVSVFTTVGDTDMSLMNGRKLLIQAIGDTFNKLGTAVPRITDGLSSFKGETGAAFFNTFVGPVDEGAKAEGYNSQKLLWNAIGHSMIQTKESMPDITKSINAMDMNKLVETRKMFEALGVLSQGGEPTDILASMGESLEEALQNLATMLEDFKGSVAEGSAAQVESGNKITSAVGKFFGGGGSSGGPATSASAGSSDDVVAAVNQLQKALLTQGIKVKDSGNWFS